MILDDWLTWSKIVGNSVENKSENPSTEDTNSTNTNELSINKSNQINEDSNNKTNQTSINGEILPGVYKIFIFSYHNIIITPWTWMYKWDSKWKNKHIILFKSKSDMI